MEPVSISLALAFLAGAVSFLSPCVFPIVPGYVGFVTGLTLDELKEGGTSSARRQAAVHSAFFVLGFSLIFLGLGAGATALGGALTRSLPLLQQVGGVMIALFGLYHLGVLKLPALMRERRVQLAGKPAGKLGSVVVGMAFGAGWTPCIGPVLATVLLYASFEATLSQGMVLLGAYSLGLGIPFFISAVAFNWFLAGSANMRRWLVPLQRATGVGMVLLGVLLFTGQFAVLGAYLARFSPALEVGL